MRSSIIIFVHHGGYVACALCEREWWHYHNYMYICYTKFFFTPRHHRVLIRIHMGSMTTTPKVCAIGRRGLRLGKFLTRRLSPVTTGWAIRSFGIGHFGRAKRNVCRSRLNCGGGPVVVKTFILHIWFMHHHINVTCSLFNTPLEFWKILCFCLLCFPYWVVKFTPFPLIFFSRWPFTL
jgi:hypothetical protein